MSIAGRGCANFPGWAGIRGPLAKARSAVVVAGTKVLIVAGFMIRFRYIDDELCIAVANLARHGARILVFIHAHAVVQAEAGSSFTGRIALAIDASSDGAG